MSRFPTILDFGSLRATFAAGQTPIDLVETIVERMRAAADPAIFISRVPDDVLRAAAKALMARAPAPNSLPLWGLPFAVKDNIDVAGIPTTAGCPEFAYLPERHATAVARLIEAGAIFIGKTNLDQFATGLNGTRSPYGAPRCVFDATYVSGGSSSGSAVAMAAGLCAFSLGTDTAGSGRVPAAFNNIVGVKPSPGRVPITGVVPACRSLDVVTAFAANVADGIEVRRVMEGLDEADPFSRHSSDVPLPESLRVGVLAEPEREFFGNTGYGRLYEAAVARAAELGAEIVAIDYEPFRKAAVLLYDGPWVAERLAAIEAFVTSHPNAMDGTVRQIIEGARGKSAVEAYRGLYDLASLRRRTEAEWAKADVLMLPTSADIQTVAAMRADPIALNSRFGRYTNFANLLGCAAIAVPAGFTDSGLPFGVTLVGQEDTDDALASFARSMHAAASCGTGVDRAAGAGPKPARPADRLLLAVVGAHLSGMPLNGELTAAGGVRLKCARTAPSYRLFALPGGARPGLIRDDDFRGCGIEVEVWSLAPADFGRIVAAIPSPLGVGRVRLDDGSEVTGFLCEAEALKGAEEISALGGWRAYVAARAETKIAP